MKVVLGGIEFESQELDWHIGVGLQANTLARLSIFRPDLEFRIWNGRLEANYREHNLAEVIVGTAGVEPLAWDWQRICESAMQLPVRAPV